MKMVEGNWQPVFWIYFDEAREILSKKRLMNPLNDASVMTYDDFFVRRLFTSTIIKQTNPGNKTIMEIVGATDPKDPRVLAESEKIQQSLENFQNGMWKTLRHVYLLKYSRSVFTWVLFNTSANSRSSASLIFLTDLKWRKSLSAVVLPMPAILSSSVFSVP